LEGIVTDALNQDVQALKEWLRTAWLLLADPTFAAFERRELRNYMKEANRALRTDLQKLAAVERSQKVREDAYSRTRPPDFRILKASIDVDLKT
jgi:hypothetical protein